jgi:hypothetical protein
MINVRDYGAVGDGVGFDDVAFASAIAAVISAGGGALYLPAGSYNLAGPLDIAVAGREHFAIKGDGKYASQLLFHGTNGPDGLRYVSTSIVVYDRPTFEIEGVGLVSVANDNGTALSVAWADDANIEGALNVRNVMASRASVKDDIGFWTRGIDTYHARNSTISDYKFVGRAHGTGAQSQEAIMLRGQSTAVHISDVHILETTTGILAMDVCEGLNINQADIVAVKYGVRHDILSGAEPQLSVANSHINATDVCVWSNNVQQGGIVNNLFYAFSGLDVVNPWWGIIIGGENARSIKIIGNSFEKDGGHNGPTTHGIHIIGGHSYVMMGNQFQGRSGSPMSYGIVNTPTNSAKGLNTAQYVTNPNI